MTNHRDYPPYRLLLLIHPRRSLYRRPRPTPRNPLRPPKQCYSSFWTLPSPRRHRSFPQAGWSGGGDDRQPSEPWRGRATRSPARLSLLQIARTMLRRNLRRHRGLAAVFHLLRQPFLRGRRNRRWAAPGPRSRTHHWAS
eukprot:1798102-Pleurochrysis_carterae.AAC.1